MCKKLILKKIYNAKGGGGGKFRLQTKSIKICENIGKPHFSYLCCQTACFKKLLNQQKIWLNVKDIRKIKDGVIGLQYPLLHPFLTQQDRQH